ncbi:MAG: lipase [Spirochaetales bacterium]|nr:lipase [Spirochaetales bacterium]
MKKAGSIVAVLLTTLIGLELGLRLIANPNLEYYRRIKLLHSYHPEYYVGLMPGMEQHVTHYNKTWSGTFRINSLGYRGPEVNPHRSHLACVGDSLVMGFGVSDEDTFCHHLNDLQHGGETLQAVNLGVDAFGSVGNYQRLKEATEHLNLKTALYFVSPNDFTLPEPLKAQGILPDDEVSVLRDRDPSYKKLFFLQFEATRLSYLLNALVLSVEQLKVRTLMTGQAFRSELERSGLRLDRPLHGFGEYLRSAFYRPRPAPDCNPRPVAPFSCPEPVPAGITCEAGLPDPAALEPLPEITAQTFQKLIDLSQEKQFELIVVFLPIEVETHHCTSNNQYSPFYNFALRAGKFFEERGIRTLDLREHSRDMCGFIDESRKPPRRLQIKDFFIPGDGHLTVAGNVWAARAIKSKLTGNAF